MRTILVLTSLTALWTSMGSMMLGLDNIVSSQILAFSAFQKQYGVPFASAESGYLVPASWQSYWAAAAQSGDFAGAIAASYLLEKIGRKPNVLISAILTSVGVGLQLASTEWKLYFVGRLVNGRLYPSISLVLIVELTQIRRCYWDHVYSIATLDW
jgi:MFS family permease